MSKELVVSPAAVCVPMAIGAGRPKILIVAGYASFGASGRLPNVEVVPLAVGFAADQMCCQSQSQSRQAEQGFVQILMENVSVRKAWRDEYEPRVITGVITERVAIPRQQQGSCSVLGIHRPPKILAARVSNAMGEREKSG
jgi:hypothetical protein